MQINTTSSRRKKVKINCELPNNTIHDAPIN